MSTGRGSMPNSVQREDDLSTLASSSRSTNIPPHPPPPPLVNNSQVLSQEQLFQEGISLANHSAPMIKQVLKNLIFAHYKYCAGESKLEDTGEGSLASTIMNYLNVQDDKREGFWSSAKGMVLNCLSNQRQQVNSKLKAAYWSKCGKLMDCINGICCYPTFCVINGYFLH